MNSSDSEVVDSDADPEYVYEGTDCESNDSLAQSNTSEEAEALLPRSASPSKINVLNLSDADSSSEDEIPVKNKIDKGTEESNSHYFSIPADSKCDNTTNYDFSHIIDLQNRISKAREEHDKNTETSVKCSEEKPTDEDCSIADLLAIGEKTCVLQEDSLTETESENDSSKPQEAVTITLNVPSNRKDLSRKKNRLAKIEKHLQAIRKEKQVILHKVHLLCLIGHGNFINSYIINNDTIYGFLLSLLPDNYSPPLNISASYIKKLLSWFVKTFNLQNKIPRAGEISIEKLESAISKNKVSTLKDGVLLFVSLLRGLGLMARFVISLQPVKLRVEPIKNTKITGQKKNDLQNKVKKTNIGPKSSKKVQSVSLEDNLSEPSTSAKSQAIQKNVTTRKNVQTKGQRSNNKTADTLKNRSKTKDPVKSKVMRSSNQKASPRKLVKCISSDSSESDRDEKRKPGIDYWAEVYIESEQKWISVDIFSGKVDCPNEISVRCTQPVTYIIGWNNDNTLKDVTRRYLSSWLIKAKKIRVAQNWWTETLQPFRGKETLLDKKEDELLEYNEKQIKAPIPTKISMFKNHPLYALQRHLLKFEGIYPPDAAPLGYVRGEPVYSRFCVYELFSREKWIRQGKCVRVNEKPYKIVKSRAKPQKFAGPEKPLELFGHWQVEDYMAPPAVDNKVPRNEYGNIEVYTPSMLPAGTVHLQVPGLLKLARKLDIDCAPAVIGWEHHSGRSHPVIEGIVVCQQFQDVLMDAWNAEIDASAQRSDHKRKQTMRKKWLKIVKFCIVKSNLKKKYNFGESKNDADDGPPYKLAKNEEQ